MMQHTRQDGVEAANMLIILWSRWMPQSYSLYSCPTFNALVTRSITSLGNIQYVYVNIYTEYTHRLNFTIPRLHAIITGVRTSPAYDVASVLADLEYCTEVLSVIISNTEE